MFWCGAPQSASQQTHAHTLSVSFSLPAHETALARGSVSTQSSQVRLMTPERGALICFVMAARSYQGHCGRLSNSIRVPKVELVCNKPGLPLPCQHKPSSLQRTTLVLPWRRKKSKESRPGIVPHRHDSELELFLSFSYCFSWWFSLTQFASSKRRKDDA